VQVVQGSDVLERLFSQAEVEAMPDDPRQRFVGIEALCRDRLAELIRGEESWQLIVDHRVIYMSTVISTAKFYRIEPFASMEVPRRKNFEDDEYDAFIQDVQFYLTQMTLEAAERNTRTSLLLEGSVRQRLQTLTLHLREQVEKSNWEPVKIDRLVARIAAFERELAGERLRLVTVAVFTLAVCGAVADVDGTGNAITKLVHQIEQVIGKAKDAQDMEAVGQIPTLPEPRRLEPPRKEEPKRKSPAVEDFSRPDFDDEIPF
jgi:hypothetical protein